MRKEYNLDIEICFKSVMSKTFVASAKNSITMSRLLNPLTDV